MHISSWNWKKCLNSIKIFDFHYQSKSENSQQEIVSLDKTRSRPSGIKVARVDSEHSLTGPSYAKFWSFIIKWNKMFHFKLRLIWVAACFPIRVDYICKYYIIILILLHWLCYQTSYYGFNIRWQIQCTVCINAYAR